MEDATRPEDGPWTQLRTLQYGHEDRPVEIYFEKGWPELIVQIVALLTEVCGTLCVVPDTGDSPLVVQSGVDVEALLRSWEHTAPDGDADA